MTRLGTSLQKAPILVCITLSGVVSMLPTGVSAQEIYDTDRALIECDRVKKSSSRLACIEDVIKQVKERAGIVDDPLGLPPRKVDDAEVAETTPDTGAAESPAETVVAKTEPETDEKPEIVAKTPEDKPEVVARQFKPVRETFAAEVTQFRDQGSGNKYFLLDNGTIWKRANGPKFRMKDPVGKNAALFKNKLGAWRMKVEDYSQIIWVIRIK